jgi:hypothetical protein
VKQDGLSYAVVMHTPVVGVTTGVSKHPRYEFVETTKSGAKASFGANDGKTHTMYTKQKVTHLPAVAKHTCVNQVFDGNKKHAYWELFVSESKGMYAYLFDSNGGHVDYTIDSDLKVG